jgi:hypothetical protein
MTAFDRTMRGLVQVPKAEVMAHIKTEKAQSKKRQKPTD